MAMRYQVWALRNPDGSFRGKFHRHDSYDCAGRRMYEEKYADREDYVLVNLRELPGRQGACQFECCFHGLKDAAAVAGNYAESRISVQARPAPPPAPPRRGITYGQKVGYQELTSGETKTRTISAKERPDPTKQEISPRSPVGRALIGHEIGDVVAVELPHGRINLQIVSVDA
jgi:hypothetical protein